METYITKGKDILTRVTLQIDNADKYIIESPYSDSDMRELTMRCIEAYLASINISKAKFLKAISSIVKEEQLKYVKEFARPVKIRMIFEQYDKREIVERESSFNIAQGLIETLKSCVVMATCSEDCIKDFLIGYLEENGIEVYLDDEEYSDEDSSTISIEA